MATCPIELPQCKRKLMSSNKPYKKKQCPLNVKPRCSLVPPSCPLLPQDNVCGLSKIQDPNASVNVTQCPAKSPCLLAPPGCPVSINCSNFSTDNNSDLNNNRASNDTPNNVFPCPLENCSKNKVKNIDQSKGTGRKKKEVAQTPRTEGSKVVKPGPKSNPKCPMSSNVRPLPCSECILDELSVSAAGGDRSKVKSCPFLKIADACGPCCDCAEVPDVIVDPPCPFLPKPCACCTTPRCPLSRKPDCILKPKPQCGLLNPPCCCGKNYLGQPCTPCSPPKCPLSSPLCLCGTCKPSCLNPPKCICICGLCSPGQSSCPLNPPNCLCGGCPLGKPCPLKRPKCVCGSCIISLPPCLSKPSCCCGTEICRFKPPLCPLNPPICPAFCSLKPPICPGSCPLSSQPCPLTIPPSCPPTSDPCPLLKKQLCPPIPPPCSINKYELPPIPAKTTFHVPLCPQYKPPCKVHAMTSTNNDLICPFAPHPCPLGPTCPFPVSLSGNKNAVGSVNTKMTGNITESPTSKQYERTAEDICPGSEACGVIPQPECPAAEVLCPERYKKKEKPKKEECPFKECMRKPECPFSKAMPNVDCPMTEDSDCPLAKEPDCPVAELATKCPLTQKCCACLPPGCPLSTCSSKPSCPLPQSKKVPEKSNACPLSKPTDCMLSKITADCPLLPKVDCPLASKPDCPLAPKPECPLAEFATITGCPSKPKSCPLAPQPKCPITGKASACPLSNPPECVLSSLIPEQKMPTSSIRNSPLIVTPESNVAQNSGPPTSITKSALPIMPRTGRCPIANPSECILSKINSTTNNNKDKSDFLIKSDGVPPGKRNTPIVAFRQEKTKDCPLTNLIPKRNCPLEPPPCPLTPKPACPLTKKPDPCPLTVSKNKPYCPVEYPPCSMFPEGRCPMGDLNLCDCDYPVSPCLLPLQANDVVAPPQYCVKENCCMGLSLPPVEIKPKVADSDLQSDAYYYKFMNTKPGKEDTKHYIQVLSQPPKLTLGLFGEPKKRVHDNWSVVRSGEGYKRCKFISEKLEEMGPIRNSIVQYKEDDCPLDPITERIMENRKKQEREQKEIRMIKESLGLKRK